MESNQTGSDLGSWKAQTPENVGSQRAANSGGDRTSKASLSPDLNPNSSGDSYAVIIPSSIPSSIDAKVCTYCRKLAVDILTRPAKLCPGWEVLHS